MRQSPKVSRPSFTVKSLIEEKPLKQLKKGQDLTELSRKDDDEVLRDEWGQQIAKALDKDKEGVSFEAKSNEWFEAGLAAELGSYRFYKHLRQDAKPLSVFLPQDYSRKHWERGRILGQSVNLARHFTNLPSNYLNPKTYSEALTDLFRSRKGVTVEVLGPQELLKAGCGLLHATGRGAVEGSRLVRVRYKGKGTSQKRPFVLVGKGITFDSGGLDIKTSSGMRLMKKDMAGSATVAGIMNWLTLSESPVFCEAYFALAENSVSSDSMRPGDVIQSKSGQFVEIHNTDAEGRLVLADAISMAYENLKEDGYDRPEALFDFATLTGAMRVALGPRIAGFFATHDDLAEQFVKAAEQAHEPVWRMPLFEEYDSYYKSNFADFANASDSGFAGAITAALFLKKFVTEKTPWIHVDMFGWADKPYGALVESGGNGQCVQIMAKFFEEFS